MAFDSEKINLFIMRLISFAAFLFAAYLIALAFHSKNILLFIIAALPIGIIASLLCVRYFLPAFAEAFADFLLMPRRFLDKAPLILSAYYGDLERGAYQKVIDELQELPARTFLDPEVVFIYAQACMNCPGHENDALEKMENLFCSSGRDKDRSRDYMRLLMFYADTARKRRKSAHIIRILSGEAARRCYNDNEKRAIRTRCAALGKDVRS